VCAYVRACVLILENSCSFSFESEAKLDFLEKGEKVIVWKKCVEIKRMFTFCRAVFFTLENKSSAI